MRISRRDPGGSRRKEHLELFRPFQLDRFNGRRGWGKPSCAALPLRAGGTARCSFGTWRRPCDPTKVRHITHGLLGALGDPLRDWALSPLGHRVAAEKGMGTGRHGGCGPPSWRRPSPAPRRRRRLQASASGEAWTFGWLRRVEAGFYLARIRVGPFHGGRRWLLMRLDGGGPWAHHRASRQKSRRLTPVPAISGERCTCPTSPG